MDESARRQREATAIVMGCDAIGSAVAHRLHGAGWAVVVIDDIDPPAPHRGLSFANAWYLGSAELDGIAACFCSSVKSIPSVLHRRNLVAATSWSWAGVAAVLVPEVLVDTRFADGGGREALLARAPAGLVTVGCGPGYAAGVEVHVAVETSHGGRAGRAIRVGTVPSDMGTPSPLGGAGMERFVVAPRTGRMRTRARVGDPVGLGDAFGDVNGVPLLAPIAGVLRGLSARGARVNAGAIVAEVDPRGVPAQCYGLDERGRRVAEGVVSALDATDKGAVEAPVPGLGQGRADAAPVRRP